MIIFFFLKSAKRFFSNFSDISVNWKRLIQLVQHSRSCGSGVMRQLPLPVSFLFGLGRHTVSPLQISMEQDKYLTQLPGNGQLVSFEAYAKDSLKERQSLFCLDPLPLSSLDVSRSDAESITVQFQPPHEGIFDSVELSISRSDDPETIINTVVVPFASFSISIRKCNLTYFSFRGEWKMVGSMVSLLSMI